MDQQYSLRWNNYLNQITNAFDSLKNEEDLVDVTISCEGKKLKAHKMLLSACSPYFRSIFKDNPCQHPVIVFRNFKFVDLEAVIEFMYKGEVDVKQEQFESFLTTAELLEVKGLTDGLGATNHFEEEDSDASKTFGSETDLLPEQPSTISVSSEKQEFGAEGSRSSSTKKRKSNISHPVKGKSLEKRQKSAESDNLVIPKIEKDVFIEDLTFDDDTDDSHSASTDLSQVPLSHSRSEDYSSIQNQPDFGQPTKGLSHFPDPGSSVELSPDIMQTQEIVHSRENEGFIKPDQITKEQDDSDKCVSASKLLSSDMCKNSPTKNLESEDRINSFNQKENTLMKCSLKPKTLNLPKGLTITMREKDSSIIYESNQTIEEHFVGSEEPEMLVQEDSFSNQEQLPQIVSDPNIMSNQLELDTPKIIEEMPQVISDEIVGEVIQEQELTVEEEKEETEFDYFGCKICKADSKPVDKFNLVLTHKCPICPCVCFCAHLLKEHMKMIHGWFNVKRKWY